MASQLVKRELDLRSPFAGVFVRVCCCEPHSGSPATVANEGSEVSAAIRYPISTSLRTRLQSSLFLPLLKIPRRARPTGPGRCRGAECLLSVGLRRSNRDGLLRSVLRPATRVHSQDSNAVSPSTSPGPACTSERRQSSRGRAPFRADWQHTSVLSHPLDANLLQYLPTSMLQT
jgi:hypothetical protein